MTEIPSNSSLFDLNAIIASRNRFAKVRSALHEHVAECLYERLQEINRPFSRILMVGYRPHTLLTLLEQQTEQDQSIVVDLVEPSPILCELAQKNHPTLIHKLHQVNPENFIPNEEAYDLILSNLYLHWINQIQGFLRSMLKGLEADGLLLCSMIGGYSLMELRQALITAETELKGGASPRLSPMIDIKDMGNLMLAAGFRLPMVDRDPFYIEYNTIHAGLRILQRMGESNKLNLRVKTFTPKQLFDRAGELMNTNQLYFDVLYLTGWKAHPEQQRPLSPGSAKHALKDQL